MGDWVAIHTTKETDIACSFKLLKGDQLLKYGALENQKIKRFYFKSGLDLDILDKINIGDEYYEILDIEDVAGVNRLLHVDVRKIVADMELSDGS